MKNVRLINVEWEKIVFRSFFFCRIRFLVGRKWLLRLRQIIEMKWNKSLTAIRRRRNSQMIFSRIIWLSNEIDNIWFDVIVQSKKNETKKHFPFDSLIIDHFGFCLSDKFHCYLVEPIAVTCDEERQKMRNHFEISSIVLKAWNECVSFFDLSFARVGLLISKKIHVRLTLVG